ncbi:Indoleamine 2,3-dioxygenase [Endogone sp. FLAS-F59071]|nr:Indoleamine 2,3-dioxygenase [Endogone sp. FLAS-F59071]|eukprot:RUS18976.1 Indoleamine 2,3-dioxygenase [Endogone sp. FLAS-F59071]
MPNITIPRLEDYDISPHTGFLPEESPLQRLPDPYFEPWETVIQDLESLLRTENLRERIDELPILDVDRVTTQAERQRAFLVLAMLSHSYVWGKQHKAISDKLPRCLSVPWARLATRLGMYPVNCHASMILWNWRLLSPEPIELDNLAALSTFTGSLDESGFYMVTTAVEAAGAPSLSAIIAAIHAIDAHNLPQLLFELSRIRPCLTKMTAQLVQMFQKCRADTFYWKIRPYLASWENMAEANLPLGLIYEGVDDISENMSHPTQENSLPITYRKYVGVTAAQSSIIQAIDIAFGVEHGPTGEKRTDNYTTRDGVNQKNHQNRALVAELKDNTQPAPPNRNDFLMKMRQYMPGPHRAFLEHLTKAANIRPFMLDLADRVESGAYSEKEFIIARQILDGYNACLHELKLFRDKHVQIVSLYIIQQARRGRKIVNDGPITTQTVPKTPSPTLFDAVSMDPGSTTQEVAAPEEQHPPTLDLKKTFDENLAVRGTGGADVIPFLKQSRDETVATKIKMADDKVNSKEIVGLQTSTKTAT